MNWSRHLLRTAPLLILITQLPFFLQSHLTPDTVLYDLQAKCLLNGGVLYRDIVEPNLPGVVWVHALVRTCAGESSFALRLFDLAVLGGIACLLPAFVGHGWPHHETQKVARRILFSVLLMFYLSTSEWCHCQRDTWMLLPCLAAMWLRVFAIKRGAVGSPQASNTPVDAQKSATSRLCVCFLEGTLWATGFWLKPFVAIPALAVLAVSCMLVPARKFAAQQMAAVLAGGLCTGLAGILWMMQTGCWAYFVDMLTNWNGDYFQAGRNRWTFDRYLAHAQRFFPWIVLHLPAVAIAGRSIVGIFQRRGNAFADVPESDASIVLQAGYLGWLLQAFALQQLFDYIHVPGIMLALAVCIQAATAIFTTTRASSDSGTALAALRNLLLPSAAAFVAVALLTSPATVWTRQRHWGQCLQACIDRGTELSAKIKDDIALTPMPRWRELQPVIEKLHDLCNDNRSVLAYNGNLIHLYSAMNLQPPTRFVYMDVLARCFPRRRPEMLTAIEDSHVQFVVSDLIEDGWSGDDFTSEPKSGEWLPKTLARQSDALFFPYNQTPLFRSGGYVIFRVDKPLGWLTDEYSPLSHGQWWQLTGVESSAAKK